MVNPQRMMLWGRLRFSLFRTLSKQKVVQNVNRMPKVRQTASKIDKAPGRQTERQRDRLYHRISGQLKSPLLYFSKLIKD